MIIISIGYAACHWCHVMEKETYEDTAGVRIMNDHFISIKVDREERPDVDQVYGRSLDILDLSQEVNPLVQNSNYLLRFKAFM